MSALVWAVESVVLSLWALVFVSLNANPFHTFIAWSHLLISSFTLFVQLYTSARGLPIGHAVSESFVCAVSSLFVIYIMAVLDSDNYSNPKLFSMPVMGGFLPIDACIGLAWFSAVTISAIGMALCERGRVCTLMFHHFGYHMLIVPPSFLIFWLYNYDASATEPVSQGITFFYHGARITHFLYLMVLIGIWGAFVVLQAMGEILQFEAEWPDFDHMSANGKLRYALSVLIKLLGRAACVLIPISAAFTARTGSQVIIAWVLTGLGDINAFDWMRVIDAVLKAKRTQSGGIAVEPEAFIGASYRPFDPAAFALRRDAKTA